MHIIPTLVAAATASVLPNVTTPRDDLPPETWTVVEVADGILSAPGAAGDLCDAYGRSLDVAPPEMTMTVEGIPYSALDSMTIIAFEEALGGRLTDAARDYFVAWLHVC